MASQVIEPGAIRRTRAVKDAITYVTLAVAGLITAGPIVYLVATSLKQTYTRTVDLSVLWNPSLVNYYNVWFVHPFRQWMINSLIVATIVTVAILFIDSLAGYAFAKKRFRGREAFFLVLLSTLMVPLPVMVQVGDETDQSASESQSELVVRRVIAEPSGAPLADIE